jgi:hypothetical protein
VNTVVWPSRSVLAEEVPDGVVDTSNRVAVRVVVSIRRSSAS